MVCCLLQLFDWLILLKTNLKANQFVCENELVFIIYKTFIACTNRLNLYSQFNLHKIECS